ncbi:hypothetical protein [Rickettsiella grylli]|uniref:Uncharacterized protein n=1 Tax=Rickettsiella grylli TaxID=59196 RepID=A8PQ34_9COXI|nr:hypothetical protein [Rickettsiella grylli]EDP45654.1 hypothetical protein RICGR_1564 [Rickettsiella grylli]EDP45722.1 hypothetical protein RICGR_1421 [Rickettsiella grylli]OJA01092.1 hypothetical protein BEV13_00215 [Rickettsiella grylli]
MLALPQPIRYQIVAQYRDNMMLINILDQGLYFIRSAYQIFTIPTLMNGFSQEDAAIIKYIVNSENHNLK